MTLISLDYGSNRRWESDLPAGRLLHLHRGPDPIGTLFPPPTPGRWMNALSLPDRKYRHRCIVCRKVR